MSFQGHVQGHSNHCNPHRSGFPVRSCGNTEPTLYNVAHPNRGLDSFSIFKLLLLQSRNQNSPSMHPTWFEHTNYNSNYFKHLLNIVSAIIDYWYRFKSRMYISVGWGGDPRKVTYNASSRVKDTVSLKSLLQFPVLQNSTWPHLPSTLSTEKKGFHHGLTLKLESPAKCVSVAVVFTAVISNLVSPLEKKVTSNWATWQRKFCVLSSHRF